MVLFDDVVQVLRELQNVIERAFVLSKGPVLKIEGSALFDFPRVEAPASTPPRSLTLSTQPPPASTSVRSLKRSSAAHCRRAHARELADRWRPRGGKIAQSSAKNVAQSDAETGHRAALGVGRTLTRDMTRQPGAFRGRIFRGRWRRERRAHYFPEPSKDCIWGLKSRTQSSRDETAHEA
jgi:hypothetical protein